MYQEVTVVAGTQIVVIDGKEHDLSIVPNRNSALVQAEMKNIMGQLNLGEVVEKLSLAVDLYEVAYNGVAGARGGTLQATISKLQGELALLCNDCVMTMNIFASEAKVVCHSVNNCKDYLQRAKEKLAMRKLAHCVTSAMDMERAAVKLLERFQNLQAASAAVRAETIEEETGQRDRRLAAEQAEREIRARQKAEQANQEELLASIESINEQYQEVKAREETESTKALVLGVFSAIANVVSAGVGAFMAAKGGGGLGAGQASGGAAYNPQVDEAQRNTEEKRKKAADAQNALLEVKDQQSAKQGVIDKLKLEVKELSDALAQKQQTTSVKAEDLTELKKQKDAKQAELDSANAELKAINSKVASLESTSKDRTAAYAAANAALSELATQTGNMAAASNTAAQSVHQEKLKCLEQKLAMEREKRKSLVDLAGYAETMKNLQFEAGAAGAAAAALHAAVEALAAIIGILVMCILFWQKMAKHCKDMHEQGFVKDIEDIINPETGLTPEERREEYSRPAFMAMFAKYMCQWVALHLLASDYADAAAKTQKKAVEALQRAPTIEEALKAAPKLAKTLQGVIDKDLAASRRVSVELEQEKACMEAQNVEAVVS